MMKDKKPLTSASEVPRDMTLRETAEFWDTHELTEDYLVENETVGDEGLPAKRTSTKTISLRMDVDTIERLQQVARKKQKGYQTLLKQFVIERLYEEEKKLGG